MTSTVIGLFGNTEEAKKAARAITKAGLAEREPRVLGPNGQDIGEELSRRGFDDETARRHADAVKTGSVLVLAGTADDKADDVAELIDRHGAISPEEAERETGSQREENLAVVEEEAEVRKKGVTKGAVRVSRHVSEQPFRETVTLQDKHVEVERRDADRPLSAAEAEEAFQEKTAEYVESSEKAVVEKTARVVGEVAVRQETEEHEERVEGTVRRSDVEVEDLKAGEQENKTGG